MKRFLLFWIFVLMVLAVFAQGQTIGNGTNGQAQREPSTHVTAAQAMDVGYAFMHTGSGSKSGGTQSGAVRKQAMQLVYTGRATDSLTRATTDCYYVFALQPKGFVIVAADNRVEPILGYSYDNNFVVENMPEQVRGWLGNYEKQIEAVVKQDIVPEAETTTKWSRLKSGQAMSNTRDGNSVGPLLTTQWNQDWPFNAMCPVDEYGNQCLVGCLPVAVGQIMKYYNWPPKGFGYVHYDEISAVFDTTYYDWESMPDEWTDSGYESMAQLLSDIGKSMFAEFSPSATSVREDLMQSSLADVFNYDYFSMQYIMRNGEEDDAWFSLIKNELDNNRPVYYGGWNSEPPASAGHAWVCDGYDDNSMCHFNFGWGGLCDGYYQLSFIINPFYFNYNYQQRILIGIQPSMGNTLSSNDTLSGSLSFNESLYCGAFSNITIMPGTELKFAPGKALCFAGSVLANGNEENPILITAADTTLGWAGMQIHPSLMYYKMEAKEPDTLGIYNTTISYSNNNGVDIAWPNYYSFPATTENVVHKGIRLDHVKIKNNSEVGIAGNRAVLTLDSCEISNNGDWGIYADLSGLDIRNSKVNNNFGAIFQNTQADIFDRPSFVINNDIFNNDYGIYVQEINVINTGNATIRANRIYNNCPHDGDVQFKHVIRGGAVEDNLIYDNNCESAVLFASPIVNNSIYNNTGKALYIKEGAEIFNNLVFNNREGVYSSSGDANMYNNTIVNNNVGINYGLWGDGVLFLNNNIIWNNGEEINVNHSQLNANNNIIKGGSTSVMGTDPNNIINHTCDKDPKFVNPTTFIGPGEMPENVSFELDFASPAIDNAYMDSTMALPTLDLVGNPRIKRVLDIGAYENQSDTIHPCFLTEGYSTKSCVGLSIDLTLPYRGEQCSFAWYHNGDMMQGPFSDTLHLENVTENDEGDYYCVISNTIGIDTSSIIHLGLSPQLPMCVEAINGPDTIYHFQQSIPFSINNVMDADMIQWVVSEGLSYSKTSDTTILLSVNQAVESAFLYVVASNGCGACADTAMIQFTVLPSPETLQLNGPSFVIVNYGYPWPQPELVADGAFHYDAIEWQSPSWISTVSDNRKLIFVSTQSYQGSADTIFARWFINGYGYGVWTPYPIKVVHPEDYGDIVYVSTEGIGNGSSWADATDIQTALSLASYLDKKVWVASGIYEGDGSAENAFVIEDGVLVYGGFVGNEPSDFDLSQRDLTAHSTIFDGQHLQRTVFHSWFWFQDADSQPMIDGVIIQNGYGNNVFDNSDNGILLRNCIIRNGVGDCGGVEHAILENCVLSNNQGDGWAGAIKNSTAINCSFVNNMASVSVASSSTLNNCILWNNGGYDHGLTNTFSYCAIQEEMIEGEGNITLAHSNNGTSPDSNYVRFADPENGDFRLAYGSACINAGIIDTTGLGLSSVDLQGLPRVLDGRIDMGAYEYYPVPVVEMYDTICEGSSVMFHGFEYTDAGNYQVHTNPDLMQDTLNILHLTVTYGTHNAIVKDTCDIYEWHGMVYTESNTYTFDYTNETGCPSTDTLQLTIHNAKNLAFTVDTCDWYTWNGETYTTSGTYYYTHADDNNCTQVDTLYLTINHATNLAFTVDTCDWYTWHGETYTTSGTYYYTHADDNNCTQVDTLYLTIGHSNTGDTTAFACNSFTWYGTTYTETPVVTPTHTFTNASGCDSVITLHLTIGHSNTGDTTAFACNSFTWYGTTYTETPEVAPTHTFTNASGCDSVVTLHLTVGHSNTGDTTAFACNSFTWYGETYIETPAVAPTHTFTNVSGCDSVVTLHLTVGHATTGDTTAFVCNRFDWYEHTNIMASGEYTHTLPNASGCDSVVTLHLTVGHATTGDTTAFACNRFDWYEHTNIMASGEYTHTLTNASGCDSVVTLHLTIGHSNTGDTTAFACNSFTWYGETYTETPAVAPTHTFTNASGCDFVVTLHLTIGHSNTGDTTAFACNSFTWYGETYTETPAVAPTYTFTNASGCDSVVTLHLTVGHSNTGDTTAFACNSFTWYGQTFSETPDVAPTHIFTNASGCDSVVTLHLTIGHSNTGDTTAFACNSFTWYGQTFTETPDVAPTHTFTNASGCDSVVTLHLTIGHSNTGDTTAFACNSFTWYGETYTETPAVAPTYTFTNASGCDSVVTLHLTVGHSNTGDTTAFACNSFTWYGETYTETPEVAPTHTFTNASGCDSVVTLHLTIGHSNIGDTTAFACNSFTWCGETYTETPEVAPTHTFTNASGCDSVVTLHLTINTPVAESIEATACDSYTWNGEIYTESGDYIQTFTAANDCDSVVTLHLTVNPSVSIEAFLTISENDLPFTYGDTTFMPGTVQSGDYTFNFTTAEGCDSIIILHLTVETGINDYAMNASMKLYPNPTKDVVNVQLTMNNAQLGDVDIQVFDVYGKMLDVIKLQSGTSLQTQIDLSRYANGVYLIKALAEGNVLAVRKVVKK